MAWRLRPTARAEGARIAGAQESTPRMRRAHDANTRPGVQLISSAQRRLCFTAHWIRLDRPNRRMSTTPAIWPPGMNDALNFSSLARRAIRESSP